MKKINFWSVLLALTLASCTAPSPTHSSTSKSEKKMKTTTLTNQQKAIELLSGLASKDTKAVENYVSKEQYIQHNPMVADGQEPLLGLVKSGLVKKAKVVRSFQDGDYVVAQMDYDFMGPKVAFDVFRFENGKAVEHWDNLAEKSTSPNPGGHSQLDGPTEVTDLDKTAANKALVKDFVETVLIEQKYDQMPRFFDGDRYIQHNTQVPDGLSGLGNALKALAEQGIYMVYTKNHKILGEGNFVLAMSEGSFGGQPMVFYDLFRVQDGKIAEHWDVIEPIGDATAAKNKNGKF